MIPNNPVVSEAELLNAHEPKDTSRDRSTDKGGSGHLLSSSYCVREASLRFRMAYVAVGWQVARRGKAVQLATCKETSGQHKLN